MSEPEPNVVVVSAPSGAGKSTVLARVVPSLERLRFSVSHTTRSPRSNELEGKHYHFVDRGTFETLIGKGAFLEHAEVHGQLYGTSQAEYETARREQKDLLMDLDVQGAAKVRRKLPDAVTVFILPPSFVDLEERVRTRRLDDEPSIVRRLEDAREEMNHCGEYDYILVNDDLDRCARLLAAIIEAARSRRSRMAPIAEAIRATFAKKETKS